MNIFNNSRSHSKLSTTTNSLLNKKRLTQDQVRLLEASFDCNKKLDPEQKLHLALQLGIPPRQIAIWYQNKRARWKNQSLELDYSALQLKLEKTLVEKQLLEKEIEQLRVELHKAKDHALLLSQTTGHDYHKPPPPGVSSFSSGGGGGGTTGGDGGSSSSLHDDVLSCSWGNYGENHEALQLEELYACLIGSNQGLNRNLSIPQKGKFPFFKL